jgi:hypothetical protein
MIIGNKWWWGFGEVEIVEDSLLKFRILNLDVGDQV